MTTTDFEQNLDKYAEIIVKVGLNIRAGQRLLIGASAAIGGALIETAPLVRRVTEHAYRAGAQYVDVVWHDEQLDRLRFEHAPRDSFDEFPAWKADLAVEYGQRGDALLRIYGHNPDLLAGQDSALIRQWQGLAVRTFEAATEYIRKPLVNWLIVGAPTEGWAAKVLPGVPAEQRVAAMWEVMFDVCRVRHADPIAAWQRHLDGLRAWADYLTRKQYVALHYTAPGTDLRVGLVPDHLWVGAGLTAANGVSFTANIPTEEVFTMPRRDVVEGVVRSTKPLYTGGALIEDFTLTFEGGRVVAAQARVGQEHLDHILNLDEGARSLGEVALVPHSSPISHSGLLFYNTLYDENASCHIALGAALPFTLKNGGSLSREALMAAGGNYSMTHVDFMVGSGQMDIDGITARGAVEPVMRGGEWAFTIEA